MKKLLVIGAAAVALVAGVAVAQFNPALNGAALRFSSPERALAFQINPPTKWIYAAASGGITDTTGVTFKAAAGATKKNYLKHISLSNSGAAGTEVLINCGASGTNIWRGWIGATQSPSSITFAVPLECAVNTLMEVKLSSGTTVAVRFNAQGWTD